MRVAQLVDSLDAGGTERVAVQIANGLDQRGFESHLLTGRKEGSLADEVRSTVARLCLDRRHTLSPSAVVRLARYLAHHRIDVLHAHSTSLFLAAAAAVLQPRSRIVWHDHYGDAESRPRPRRVYALAAARASAVLSVNRNLRRWAIDELGVAEARTHHLANWVDARPSACGDAAELPGAAGGRVVCVANLRPQKGHEILLSAFASVCREHEAASLSLVGDDPESPHGQALRDAAERLKIADRVHFLGARSDVPALLDQADVGVLSSLSEGLPLALLEYGHAALPVVVTNVGDCAEVVEHRVSGLVVERGDPTALGAALLQMLDDRADADAMARRLAQHVAKHHSADAALDRLVALYHSLDEPERRAA